MSYVVKAVLSNAQHPEYGQVIVPFPIPDAEYDYTMELLEALEIDSPDTWLSVAVNELPERVAEALDLEHIAVGDLPDLNRLCRAIRPMKEADLEKLNAVVLMAEPQSADEICQLAENLDQFDFIPDVQTLEEYGQYMIRESGHFEYDENLEGFYDYRLYGERRTQEEGGRFNEYDYVLYRGTLSLEELMRPDPVEQYRQELRPKIGGLLC